MIAVDTIRSKINDLHHRKAELEEELNKADPIALVSTDIERAEQELRAAQIHDAEQTYIAARIREVELGLRYFDALEAAAAAAEPLATAWTARTAASAACQDIGAAVAVPVSTVHGVPQAAIGASRVIALAESIRLQDRALLMEELAALRAIQDAG